MERSDWIFITFIFILALGGGFAYLEFGYLFPPQSGDSFYYNTAALNLVKSEGFPSEKIFALRGPGYPFFLAGIYKIFGENNYWVVRIFQIFILAGLGILVFLIGRSFLNLSLAFAFLASATLVLWPYFIVWTSLILTEILFIFFFILSVFFLLKLQKTLLLKYSLFSGLVLGLATLIRPEILFLPIWLFFLWFFFERKTQNLKIIFRRQVLVIIIFILLIVPWLTRNVVLFQTPLPHLTFSRWSDEPGEEQKNLLLYLQEKVGEKPILTIKNIIYFWNPGAQGLRAQAILEKYPWVSYLFLIYKILFFVILVAAFATLIFTQKKRFFLFWGTIFYYWIIHGLIFPSPRHTLPVIPLVILLAWLSIERLYRSLRKKPSLSSAC